MVPNLSPAGHSFKGAYQYHAHDKGTLKSSDRIEWHSVRGLVTSDLVTAERIMIATAYDSHRLKEQAGIKATGRKSAKHVQTLSLAWHPDEDVDRVEMERAADSALKELGLEHHQSVIIAHNDTKHKHVHLIINRVNPNDGRLASLSNSKRKLDRWAHEYEKERDSIVTPKRAEKYDRQRAASKEHTASERREYAEEMRSAALDKQPISQKAKLAQRHSQIKIRHKKEWANLKGHHNDQRNADYQEYRRRLDQTKRERDRAYRENESKRRSEWRDFYQKHKQAERYRQRMSMSPIGRFALSWVATKEEQRQGSSEGFGRLFFVNFVSTERREQIFETVTKRDKRALVERQRLPHDKVFEALRTQRAEEIDAQRKQHADERYDLQKRQDSERDTLTKEWAMLNDRHPSLAMNDGIQEGKTTMRDDAATRIKGIMSQDRPKPSNRREERTYAENIRGAISKPDDRPAQVDRQISAAQRLSEIRQKSRSQEGTVARNLTKDRGRDDDLER